MCDSNCMTNVKQQQTETAADQTTLKQQQQLQQDQLLVNKNEMDGGDSQQLAAYGIQNDTVDARVATVADINSKLDKFLGIGDRNASTLSSTTLKPTCNDQKTHNIDLSKKIENICLTGSTTHCEVNKQFNNLFVERLKEIESETDGALNLKLIIYKEWVDMLQHLNDSVVRNLEDLESEVNERLTLMQRRSNAISNCRHSQGNELSKCRKDVATLMKIIQNAFNNNHWDVNQHFETLTSDDVFGNKAMKTNKETPPPSDLDFTQKHNKLLLNVKALAFEVAEKHDEVRDLQKQILSLEDEMQKAYLKIQLKDDVIKELRCELKASNQKVAELSAQDKMVSTDFESATDSNTDISSIGLNALKTNQFECRYFHVNPPVSMHNDHTMDICQRAEHEKHDAYRKLDFLRSQLVDIESVSDGDSGLCDTNDTDSRIIGSIRRRIFNLKECSQELNSQVQQLTIENSELSASLTQEKALIQRVCSTLRELADLLTSMTGQDVAYNNLFDSHHGKNPFLEPILAIKTMSHAREDELLDKLSERNNTIKTLQEELVLLKRNGIKELTELKSRADDCSNYGDDDLINIARATTATTSIPIAVRGCVHYVDDLGCEELNDLRAADIAKNVCCSPTKAFCDSFETTLKELALHNDQLQQALEEAKIKDKLCAELQENNEDLCVAITELEQKLEEKQRTIEKSEKIMRKMAAKKCNCTDHQNCQSGEYEMELKNAKKIIEELRTELNERNDMLTENSNKDYELEAYEVECNRLHKINQALTHEVCRSSACRSALQRAKQCMYSIHSELSRLRQQESKTLETMKKDCASEIKHYRLRFEELSKELSEEREHKSQLAAAIRRLNTESTEVNRKNSDLLKEIQKVTGLLEVQRNTYDNLLAKHEVLSNNFNEQSMHLHNCHKQINKLQEKFVELEKINKADEVETRLLRDELIYFKKEISCLQNKLSGAGEREHRFVDKIEQLHKVINAQDKKLQLAEASHKQIVNDLQKTKTEVSSRFDKLSQQYQSLDECYNKQTIYVKETAKILESYRLWKDAQVNADKEVTKKFQLYDEHVQLLLVDRQRFVVQLRDLHRDYEILQNALRRLQSDQRTMFETSSLTDQSLQQRMQLLHHTLWRIAECESAPRTSGSSGSSGNVFANNIHGQTANDQTATAATLMDLTKIDSGMSDKATNTLASADSADQNQRTTTTNS